MTRRERADRNPRTMADYAQWFASRGGRARAKALTAKERTAIGKKGAEIEKLKQLRRCLPRREPPIGIAHRSWGQAMSDPLPREMTKAEIDRFEHEFLYPRVKLPRPIDEFHDRRDAGGTGAASDRRGCDRPIGR